MRLSWTAIGAGDTRRPVGGSSTYVRCADLDTRHAAARRAEPDVMLHASTASADGQLPNALPRCVRKTIRAARLCAQGNIGLAINVPRAGDATAMLRTHGRRYGSGSTLCQGQEERGENQQQKNLALERRPLTGRHVLFLVKLVQVACTPKSNKRTGRSWLNGTSKRNEQEVSECCV
jgi:hypothetical protein